MTANDFRWVKEVKGDYYSLSLSLSQMNWTGRKRSCVKSENVIGQYIGLIPCISYEWAKSTSFYLEPVCVAELQFLSSEPHLHQNALLLLSHVPGHISHNKNDETSRSIQSATILSFCQRVHTNLEMETFGR